MSNEDENDGVLSRWSKRKRELANTPEETEVKPSQEEQDEALEAHELELAANREAAEEIDLETIDEESDLSLFMKEGVPEALKKAALAKLWRSSPVFANIDGLVDYDDNFADPNLIMKTFTSAYKIGKGYLKEVLEEEDEVQDIAAAANDKPSDTDESLEEDEVETELQEVAEAQLDEDDNHPVSDVSEPLQEDEPSAAPSVPLRIRLGLADAAD